MVNVGLIILMVSNFLAGLFNPAHGIRRLSFTRRPSQYNPIDLCTDPCYSEIIPGLYLSNARAAIDKNLLRQLKITHVLTVEAHRLPKAHFEGTNINTLFIRALDLPSVQLLPYFPMTNNFIDEGLKRGNVLVHCHFGVSRSATLILAYLMEKYDMTYEQAYGFARTRRRFINPNEGFKSQLRDFRRMNFDVSGFKRLEAYLQVHGRKHKYKIVSAAAVLVGLIVPLAVMIVIFRGYFEGYYLSDVWMYFVDLLMVPVRRVFSSFI